MTGHVIGYRARRSLFLCKRPCSGDSRSLISRVRSEELGTDAELGSATICVIQAMGVPLDQPKVRNDGLCRTCDARYCSVNASVLNNKTINLA